MRVVISQPMLFPWVGMFEQLSIADVFVYYDDVPFSKGSFTNRVQIKTASGSRWLTIPLLHRGLDQAICGLETQGTSWKRSHLDTLKQAYRATPHCRDMLQLVDEVYACEHASVCDLIIESMEVVRRYFELDLGRVVRSSQLEIGGHGSTRVLEMVRHFGGRVYYTGHGAASYLDHGAFESAGVRVEYMDYVKRPYAQKHPPFTPFVSILDLIANVGFAGKQYLEPRTVYWKQWLANE